MLESRAVFGGSWTGCRNNRLQKWADRNFMKFNKGRWKVLNLGRRSNVMHQHMLGPASWKAALQNLGVVVGHKPAMHLCNKGG